MKILIKVVKDNLCFSGQNLISSMCQSTVNAAEIAKKNWGRKKFFEKKINWFFGWKSVWQMFSNLFETFWNEWGLLWHTCTICEGSFFIKDKNKKKYF